MKFTPRGAGYDVIADGEHIGYVEKYESRYSLRRVYVVKGWCVRALGEPTADRRKDAPHPILFDTRREAAEYLLRRR